MSTSSRADQKSFGFGPPSRGWDYKGKSNGIRVYLAGPMRGYDKWNFPRFDEATEQLRHKGFDVVNPADLDRTIGVNENTTTLPENFIYDALRRDFTEILKCNGIVFLEGWEKSTGARAEARVGLDIGLKFWEIGPRGGLSSVPRRWVREEVECA